MGVIFTELDFFNYFQSLRCFLVVTLSGSHFRNFLDFKFFIVVRQSSIDFQYFLLVV